MSIRKYRCKNLKCERKIFAAQNKCIEKMPFDLPTGQ